MADGTTLTKQEAEDRAEWPCVEQYDDLAVGDAVVVKFRDSQPDTRHRYTWVGTEEYRDLLNKAVEIVAVEPATEYERDHRAI
jgi:hypothetical protein